MPAKSVKQQQAAGAELRRRRSGKSRREFKSMSTEKLEHFASTSHAGLRQRATRGSPPFTRNELAQGYRKLD